MKISRWAVGLGLIAIFAAAAVSPAWCAPRHPFAVGAQESTAAATGLAGLILAWQAKFHAELQAAVRALKTDPSAFLALAAASFAYGAFHAAGPGHGKAVLASYMLANETALRRGLLLAALAALLQGVVAIAVVGAAAAFFRATASQMSDATRLIELASYAAVAALGARLAWVKGCALAAALRAPAIVSSARGFVCEAIDDPTHVHDETCRHAPDPSSLGGPKFRLADAAATVIAAGLRPCSGAILVLVFTLSQGLFAAGAGAVIAMSAGTAITTSALAATAVYAKSAAARLGAKDSRRALIIARGGEFIAAMLVLALGVTLLFGLAPTTAGAA
ncbi:MAG TPA: high frequency lysogenization protein HflD [Methylocystis sp.]